MKIYLISISFFISNSLLAQTKLLGEHLDSAKLLITDIQKQFNLSFKQQQSSTGGIKYYYYSDTTNKFEVKVSTKVNTIILPNELEKTTEVINSISFYCNLELAIKCMLHLAAKNKINESLLNSSNNVIITKAFKIHLTEKSFLDKSIIQFTKNY